jgi:hypothetical protein
MSARRRILQRVFLLYLAAMLAVVLLPIGGLIDTIVNAIHAVGQGLGVPDALTPRRWEFLLNVVLFAIPTALAVLLWPRVERWVWLAVALGGSVLVELVQYLALPRVADARDVIGNVSGAIVGLAAVTILSQPGRVPGALLLQDTPITGPTSPSAVANLAQSDAASSRRHFDTESDESPR